MDTQNVVHEIYLGCHVDFILGPGIGLAYIRVGDLVIPLPQFFPNTTINYAELCVLNSAFEKYIPNDACFRVCTNTRYIHLALKNCHTWKEKNLIEEKAHSEEIEKLLRHLDRLGEGFVTLTAHQYQRNDLMKRLIKHSKHFYLQAQKVMIEKRSCELDPFFLGKQEHISLAAQDDNLLESVLWKKPWSPTEFQNRMFKAREQALLENHNNVFKLVK